MAKIYEAFRDATQTGKLVTLATVITGADAGAKLLIWPNGDTIGEFSMPNLTAQVIARAKALMADQRSERITVQNGDETVEIFIDVQVPPRKLIIVGAVHIAIHLVTFANALGYHTTVVDARYAFATPERFPHVDNLITQWPADALTALGIDESTCIVVLTHDEKLDNPALDVAIRSPARYIGALGSKKTHGRRVNALKEVGATDEQIARIHAPIGIDIGAKGPEEIAVSIMAEMVAVSRGRGK